MFRKLRFLIAPAAALLLALVVQSAVAAPGDLDPTFGVGGVALSLSPVSSYFTGGFAADAAGNSYIGGLVDGTSGGNDSERIAKFTPAGVLDRTFGSSGIHTSSLGTQNATMSALAMRTDGYLMVAGSTRYGDDDQAIFLRRLEPDGVATLDNYGYLTSYDCSAAGVTIQADFKAITAGHCNEYPYVTRFRDSSGPDTSFNGIGFAAIYTTPGAYAAVTTQPDGKVIAVGYRNYPSGPPHGLVVRYLANGEVDTGFHDATSGQGRVTLQFLDGNDYARAVAVQPDGKILVAGDSEDSASGYKSGTLARLNSDGSLDGSFATGGKLVITTPGHFTSFSSIALQPNGKIVLGGSTNGQALVARVNVDGSPDTSFAPNGLAIGVPQTNAARTYGVAVQPDGKILAGEMVEIAGTNEPAVIRLQGGEIASGSSRIAAKSKIKSPSKSKLKAKKFTKLSGSASGDGLTKVEVSILLTDKKLLKKSKRCKQLSSNTAKFKKVKAVKKKCVPTTWLKATGTTSWSYKLKKTLPPGKYTIYVRATGAAGVQSPPTRKTLTLTK